MRHDWLPASPHVEARRQPCCPRKPRSSPAWRRAGSSATRDPVQRCHGRAKDERKNVMTWKESLRYYLTYLDRHRTLPLIERLSYLVCEPTYQDAEYQALIHCLAWE